MSDSPVDHFGNPTGEPVKFDSPQEFRQSFDETEFDLQLKEQPVTVKTAYGPKRYKIKELTGAERDMYLNSMQSRFTMGEGGGVSSIKSFAGHQSGLLALCLYDDSGKLVPETEIQRYPAQVQQALFRLAQRLSGLDPDSIKNAKNS